MNETQPPGIDPTPQREGHARATQQPSPATRSPNKKTKKKQPLLLPVLLISSGFAVISVTAWFVVNTQGLDALLNPIRASAAVQQAPAQSFAQAQILKPTYTPIVEPSSTPFIQPTAEVPFTPENTPPPSLTPTTVVDTAIPSTGTPTQELPTATPTLQQANTSSVISAAIIPDTPTAEYTDPTAAAVSIPSSTTPGGDHWIDINLSQQRLYAYEGESLVNSFIVSTGTWQTPTVTGTYNIWVKLKSASMSGPGYYLPDVPYIMYFYKDYGIHGTYWHNNFGTPMSHGCVNLTISDAEWVYNFTKVGTVVNVHY